MVDNSSNIQSKERPRICAIDLDEPIIDAIRSRGLNCFSGTLGSQIKVPNLNRHDSHRCLLNCSFPRNLHEYDIVIVDLKPREPVEYNKSEHQHSLYKGSEQIFYLSRYPETVFDPRPLSAYILGNELKELLKKDSLLVVFADSQEVINYQTISIPSGIIRTNDSYEYNVYGFLPNSITPTNKIGKNTNVVADIEGELKNAFQKYNEDFIYKAVFRHPEEWVDKQFVKRDDFVPLLINASGEIISFIDFRCKSSPILVLPQIVGRQKEFLLELLEEILPGIFPKIFPYSEQFSWLKSEEYFLPHQASLLEKKKQLEEEYDRALAVVGEEIKHNYIEYQFLHKLLTETGEALVKSVENYFRWLGFPDVINMDETAPAIKEEDLQITWKDSLLIVEIKGIGGTSKDSECSQISKIKYRRAKQRGRFDVFALYLVNHQRYLPPKQRKNPPFSPQQIDDAKTDERGLLTTYELFKLYFAIEEGFVTKEDARTALLHYGLVEFKPSNARLIGFALEIHHQGTVAILAIDKLDLHRDATVIIHNDGVYYKTQILEIQIDGKPVEMISTGDVGVKFDRSILKTSELWLEVKES